jgi:hypothetical protein
VIKLGSNLIIKSGFGAAAFLGAAQPNLITEVLAAVTWLLPLFGSGRFDQTGSS